MDGVKCSAFGITGKCPNGTQEWNLCCQKCYEKEITCRKYCDRAFSRVKCTSRIEGNNNG